MDTQMITVPGRLLNAPSLTFKKQVTPREGGWNLAGQKFYRGSTMRGIFSSFQITVGNRGPRATNFAEGVKTIAGHLNSYGTIVNQYVAPGAPLNLPSLDRRFWDNIAKAIDAKFATAKKNRVSWLLISIPDRHAFLYAIIKYYGDYVYGINTVIVRDENMTKVIRQDGSSDLGLIGNLALKFCLKSGGLAWAVDPKGLKLIDGDTMVVGIDVTHPAPGSKESAPSIAAIVASYDRELSNWPADGCIQKSRREMVDGLADLMKGRLELFRKKNGGKLPKKIIVYRDGVSEGQYKLVLDTEYPSMAAAFEQLYGAVSKHPKVSIIVSSHIPSFKRP
jgi:hypothetical protein